MNSSVKCRKNTGRYLTHAASLLLCLLLIQVLSSCTVIGKWVDRSGLKSMAEHINKDFNPPPPARLTSFLASLDIEAATRSTDTQISIAQQSVHGTPPEGWLLEEKFGSPLRQRRYTFAGPFDTLIADDILTKHSPARKAVFYRYQLRDKPSKGTILFLPGMGVSNVAFRFIHRLFLIILEEGWDLVVYVPPFHLERAEGGNDSQYSLFTDDIETNIRYQLAMVREVRTMMQVLKMEESKPVGAWGGSMGASTLLLTSLWEELDHAAIMIPIINWNIVLTGEICMNRCMPAFREAGYSAELIHRAYRRISPVEYPLGINSRRVMVQSAKADQLTPAASILKYGANRDIDNIKEYRGSHATILLNNRIYKDYRAFLSSLSGK